MSQNASNPISISIFPGGAGPPLLGALPSDPRGGEEGEGREGRGKGEGKGEGMGKEGKGRGGEVCVIAVGGMTPLHGC